MGEALSRLRQSALRLAAGVNGEATRHSFSDGGFVIMASAEFRKDASWLATRCFTFDEPRRLGIKLKKTLRFTDPFVHARADNPGDAKMKKDPVLEMLAIAPKQWQRYLYSIGLLSVTFARIERELALVVSRLINNQDPGVGELLLDKLSFHHVLDHFEQLSSRLPPALNQGVQNLVSDLRQLEHDRNDLIHGCATLELGYEVNFSIERVRHKSNADKKLATRTLSSIGLKSIQQRADCCLNAVNKVYRELIEL